MEEDCGGGQGLTKGCGAKGRRSDNICVMSIYRRLNLKVNFM
jgi:hypothetical protein